MKKFSWEFSRARLKGGVVRKCATVVSHCYKFEQHLYAFCILGVCICSWWSEWEKVKDL